MDRIFKRYMSIGWYDKDSIGINRAKRGNIVKKVELTDPKTKGSMSLEEAIKNRDSCRRFKREELNISHISQLLWAAYGIRCTDTIQGISLTVPSAGTTYPMEIYLVEQRGVFRYLKESHDLEEIYSGDLRKRLAKGALGQDAVENAPVVFVIACVYRRICGRYGERGIRYAYMEAGHIAQNILLEGVSLGIQGVPIGAFREEDVKHSIRLPDDHDPLYIIPVGLPE